MDSSAPAPATPSLTCCSPAAPAAAVGAATPGSCRTLRPCTSSTPARPSDSVKARRSSGRRSRKEEGGVGVVMGGASEAGGGGGEASEEEGAAAAAKSAAGVIVGWRSKEPSLLFPRSADEGVVGALMGDCSTPSGRTHSTAVKGRSSRRRREGVSPHTCNKGGGVIKSGSSRRRREGASPPPAEGELRHAERSGAWRQRKIHSYNPSHSPSTALQAPL